MPDDFTQFLVEDEAKRQGLDPDLASRVAKQESGFRPNARSPVGAIGTMQIMPATARSLGIDPHDPVQNVAGGIGLLKRLTSQYGTERGLAAYNAGEGRLKGDRWRRIPETRNYTRTILAGYKGPNSSNDNNDTSDFAQFLKEDRGGDGATGANSPPSPSSAFPNGTPAEKIAELATNRHVGGPQTVTVDAPADPRMDRSPAGRWYKPTRRPPAIPTAGDTPPVGAVAATAATATTAPDTSVARRPKADRFTASSPHLALAMGHLLDDTGQPLGPASALVASQIAGEQGMRAREAAAAARRQRQIAAARQRQAAAAQAAAQGQPLVGPPTPFELSPPTAALGKMRPAEDEANRPVRIDRTPAGRIQRTYAPREAAQLPENVVSGIQPEPASASWVDSPFVKSITSGGGMVPPELTHSVIAPLVKSAAMPPGVITRALQADTPEQKALKDQIGELQNQQLQVETQRRMSGQSTVDSEGHIVNAYTPEQHEAFNVQLPKLQAQLVEMNRKQDAEGFTLDPRIAKYGGDKALLAGEVYSRIARKLKGAAKSESERGLAPGTAKNIVEGGVGMLPAIGATALFPAAGPAIIGLQSAGESYAEGEPLGKALVKGGVSAGSVGAMSGAGNLINSTSLGALSKYSGRALANMGIGMGAQAIEGGNVIPKSPEEWQSFFSQRVFDLAYAYHGGGMDEKAAVAKAQEQVAREAMGVTHHSQIQARDAGKFDGPPDALAAAAAKPVVEPTAPEAPATLAAQIDALKAGTKKAVLVTPGEKLPPNMDMKGFVRTRVPGVGTFWHDPAVVSRNTIVKQARAGTHGELLGNVAPRPPEGGVGVVARNADGTEIQAAEVPPDAVDAQAAALKSMHPDAAISVEHPDGVVAERLAAADSSPDVTATPKEVGDTSTGVQPPAASTPTAFWDEHKGKDTELPITQIPLHAIEIPAIGVNRNDVAKYAKRTKAGEQAPPVQVVRLNDGRLLLDEGQHRAAAAREAGLRDIDAIILSEAEYVKRRGRDRLDTKLAKLPPRESTVPSTAIPPEGSPLIPTDRRVTAGTSPDGVERRGAIVSETAPTGPEGPAGQIAALGARARSAEREAETDHLTQTGNVRALDKALPAAEADPNTSVISFDINGAGLVNKLEGHGNPAGDKVIKQAAEAIKQAARENGVPERVFRRGGDEFVALAPKAKADAIRARAEELMGEQTFEGIHGQTREQTTARVSMTGSVGDTFNTADAPLQGMKAARKKRGEMVVAPALEPTAEGATVPPEAAPTQAAAAESLGMTPPEPPASSSPRTPRFDPMTGEALPAISTPSGNDATATRRLPATIDAADIGGGGSNRTYTPESIAPASDAGRAFVTEHGIDGAIMSVKLGEGGIEWASRGYSAMEALRGEEAKARASGDTTAADDLMTKRLKFVGDFAAKATEMGQTVAGIKAIENFAPDRAVYAANKASKAKPGLTGRGRNKPLSPEEATRIGTVAEQQSEINNRLTAINAELHKRVAEAEAKVAAMDAADKSKGKPTVAKASAPARLKTAADSAMESLKPRLGNLDFGPLKGAAERPAQVGAIGTGEGNPLPGDAELVAQYGAATLGKSDLATWTKDLLVAVPEAEPYIGDIRRRAYELYSAERRADTLDRLADMKSRPTAAAEIAKEIREAKAAANAADKATAQADRAARRTSAKDSAKAAREVVANDARMARDEARQRLDEARKTQREATKARDTDYRNLGKANRDAERAAGRWDAPLRKMATEARERLATATDPKAPGVMDDLVAVGADKLAAIKGAARLNPLNPTKFYGDLKTEYPQLVTRSNQKAIYRDAYRRTQDMVDAAREVARRRGASKEVDRMWNALGLDVDTQTLLIQQVTARRQQLETRAAMTREFNRVSRGKFGRFVHEVKSFPQAAQSSIDAPLGRQGALITIMHPLQTFYGTASLGQIARRPWAIHQGDLGATAKGYASMTRAQFRAKVEAQRQHPRYELGMKSGLDLTQVAGEADPRYAAEEPFQSTVAERLPWIRMSEQGFTLGMNEKRLNMLDGMAKQLEADGHTYESNPKAFQQISQIANDLSGRGHLSTKQKIIANYANGILYSARLQISRVQAMNDLFNPVKYLPENVLPGLTSGPFERYDPAARKVVAKEALRLASGMAVVYGLAKAAGFGVTIDPDDPDFGKIRWGKHVYDPTGGEAATIRFIYRMIKYTGQAVTSSKKPPDAEDPTVMAERFARQKAAPWVALAWDSIKHESVVGTPRNYDFSVERDHKADAFARMMKENIAVGMVAPMVAGDFTDAAAEEGWGGAAKTAPSIFGVGTQMYDKREPKSPRPDVLATLTAKKRAGIDVRDEVKAAITAGTLKPSDAREIDKEAKLPPKSDAIKRFTSLGVKDALTDFAKMKAGPDRDAAEKLLVAKARLIPDMAATADTKRALHIAVEAAVGHRVQISGPRPPGPPEPPRAPAAYAPY